METIKMKSEKKKLVKDFNTVIEDLLDHYEEYTEEEKAQVKEIFTKAAELNAILDKYDVEKKINWQEYFIAVGQYFDAMNH